MLVLASFWGPFWTYFASILDPFWGYVGSISWGLPKGRNFEDPGGAKGSRTELQLSPRVAQRRAKGAKREPKGSPAGATFVHFFVIFAGFVLRFIF